MKKSFQIQIFLKLALLSIFITLSSAAWSDCLIVDKEIKQPFDGSSLKGLIVEKSSLVLLNKTYPNLNVIENMFKGEILTCTTCTEKYVTCK